MTIMEAAEKWSLPKGRDKPERLEEVKVDIESIKKAKEQCEAEMVAILDTLEQQSGLMVEGIYLDKEFTMIGFPSEKTIKLDVRLT
jgi:hypothetical protein